MTPDLPVARAFLTALDPEHDDVTFQVFAERPGASVRAAHRHGGLADVAEYLTAINRRGGGIFVTVNRTNGRGRAAAHVVALRSVFIDCDAPRVRRLALAPSVSVETRPRRGHHYWLLAADQPLEAFTPVQKQLAAYYGTDPTVTDPSRVLRLPGFFNVKAEPFQVRLVRCRPDLRYSLEEVLAAHELSSGETPEAAIVTPAESSRRVCAEQLYRRWARRAPLAVGGRNRVAFRLALEGFRAGFSHAAVEAEVREFCDRAGIGAEAASVLQSAKRIAARGFRRSSVAGSFEDGSSRAAK